MNRNYPIQIFINGTAITKNVKIMQTELHAALISTRKSATVDYQRGEISRSFCMRAKDIFLINQSHLAQQKYSRLHGQ